ncbi:MAG: hypothetical protein EOO24_38630 [Comamonadaceae bacterium]|nr:MAG: hypothetical protein EOO24_38630 [Comamonadaceae bacterium]
MPAQHNLWGVAASIALAVLASYVALDLALRVRGTYGRLRLGWWAAGSVVMGTGIWAMHFIGMAALDMSPGIVWDPVKVVLSALIAVAASAVALLMVMLLAHREARRRTRSQVLAALVMGAAICGMHYTGMAAARCFAAGHRGSRRTACPAA